VVGYNLRKNLLEGESYYYTDYYLSKVTIKDDVEKLGDIIDFQEYVGDIDIEDIKNTSSNRELINSINKASGAEYFNVDLLGKESEVKVDVLQAINDYLPEEYRADNEQKAVDNLALYIATVLNGKMGPKEDLLLFGEYTEGGRKGGIFKKIKNTNVVILLGVLSVPNGFCQTIEVSDIVHSTFKRMGLIDKSGFAASNEMFDPNLIQSKLQVKFSSKLMKAYELGAVMYRVIKK